MIKKHKKEIVKRACSGKGGLLGDTVKEIPGTIKRGIIGAAGLVRKGIKGYRDFAAREKALNDEASRRIGKVSSNQGNMDQMRLLKKKLRKEGFASTTSALPDLKNK